MVKEGGVFLLRTVKLRPWKNSQHQWLKLRTKSRPCVASRAHLQPYPAGTTTLARILATAKQHDRRSGHLNADIAGRINKQTYRPLTQPAGRRHIMIAGTSGLLVLFSHRPQSRSLWTTQRSAALGRRLSRNWLVNTTRVNNVTGWEPSRKDGEASIRTTRLRLT